MGDVIREFMSGAKNGHYFLNQCDLDLKILALPVKFIPLSIDTTSDSFRDGSKIAH
jgi:hypothetical protein